MEPDLLDRILGEIRERKQATRAAYEESQQLERALAALDAEPRGGRDATKPAARARRGANRAAILAAVDQRPGATAREASDLTGIKRTTVASTLTALAAAGALERTELPAGGVGFRTARPASAD